MSIETEAQKSANFRPPAVPLVTHDPYFSVYSTANTLTEDWPKHWTGAVNAMTSMARVDGKPFRIMAPMPRDVPAMKQTDLQLTPTRTTYTMEGGGVQVKLTFLSPLLPDDVEVLARPVTYVAWEVVSQDDKKHNVSLYFDTTAEWVVDKPSQQVTWGRYKAGTLSLTRFGSHQQPVLNRAGDDLRIEWGYLYIAAPIDSGLSAVICEDSKARGGFASTGTRAICGRGSARP